MKVGPRIVKVATIATIATLVFALGAILVKGTTQQLAAKTKEVNKNIAYWQGLLNSGQMRVRVANDTGIIAFLKSILGHPDPYGDLIYGITNGQLVGGWRDYYGVRWVDVRQQLQYWQQQLAKLEYAPYAAFPIGSISWVLAGAYAA